MRFVMRLSDWINKVVEFIVFVLILVLCGVIVLQIIFRFFFTALVWSEEVSRFDLVWLSLLAATIGVKRSAHITVTFFVDRFRGNARKFFATLAVVLQMCFWVLVLVFGVPFIRESTFQFSPALWIPMSRFYVIFPVAAAISIIHNIAELGRIFSKEDE